MKGVLEYRRLYKDGTSVIHQELFESESERDEIEKGAHKVGYQTRKGTINYEQTNGQT